MRKLLLSLSCLIFLLGCKKTESNSPEAPTLAGIAAQPDQRHCAAQEVLESQMKADPGLRTRMEGLENFIQQRIASGAGRGGSIIEVPVVVHVLYNTPEQNISADQVASQIEVLNEDFNLRNRDRTQIPNIFSSVKGDVGIRFVLSQTVRKPTSVTSFLTNDAMKFDVRGGSNAVDPGKNLNVWVCNLGQNLLGYAQFPGGRAETDGIVVLYSAFGRKGTLIPKYDLGRTATHEVGHWLNLRHIWGDRTCGTDYVDDTPQATQPNFNCPSFPKYNNCGDGAIEMTMNYMDYTADACMYMFSNGQKNRMLTLFTAGGPRNGFVQ